MKNKVTTHQNKEERIEKIELVSYRSNTGKGKGRIWERSYFEEIQVKFYQLFASVIRWRSLENLRKKVYKNIVRLTRERKEGRKEGKKKSKSSWSLAVLRITNKRTNKTEKRPRGSNGLGERSLSSEFHADRSINKEMAADLVKIHGWNMLNMPLAAQWLVEKISLLNEKRPDSREIGARRRNERIAKGKEAGKSPFCPFYTTLSLLCSVRPQIT